MHESVLQFVRNNLYPNEVKGKTVLEVGSAMINGTVRPLIEALGPSSYVGLDLKEGPGVDRVGAVESLNVATDAADLVVSCEMLEHAENWCEALESMCLLARETLILTARGPGFPHHNPPDHWRFRPHDLIRVIEACSLRVVTCVQDPQVPGVFVKAVSTSTLWSVDRAPEKVI